MHGIDNVLVGLGQRAGLPNLAFDANGNATLVFDGEIRLNMARVDETSLELWTVLEGFGPAHDAAVLRHALKGNHLGEGTGGARLALLPTGDRFVLCERILVAGLSAADLEERVMTFLKYVAFWQSPDAAAPLSSNEDDAPLSFGNEFILRA